MLFVFQSVFILLTVRHLSRDVCGVVEPAVALSLQYRNNNTKIISLVKGFLLQLRGVRCPRETHVLSTNNFKHVRSSQDSVLP
ncbi:uncharacterized protein LAESUDRAFT_30285 [Laetiporus sulphureus 93-53]|uniref:Secreted protein n=1 Tax=Laetiporus sulphureus 93-53 TaxID=1314785 RepID=A0A165IID8_9APHY|nr:uncharacterized protein LAESUDRAFT_30285 [Laetiporus sulphureus 93-53]KZT13117.1 hypothetical protein LAESUDRAFT_30285 [Laetiporus sulphureus 93-53]